VRIAHSVDQLPADSRAQASHVPAKIDNVGHDQLRAALGVGARKSATKSAMVKSISWQSPKRSVTFTSAIGARNDLFH